MAGDILIGIDAGTSVIKAVAFDPDGRQLAATGSPNRYQELPGGAVEQDLARTWADTVQVLRQLAEHVPGLRDRVLAIAVTGQGDGTWLIDRAGDPVAPAFLWLDSRSAPIVEELDEKGVRRALFQHTGCGLNACNQSAQLVWLRRHRPELLEGAATAFHCKDWLYFRLTGERATDPAEGTFTFGDFRTRRYAPEVLRALDLEDLAHLLPPMVDGSRTTHPLGAEAAVETGLRPGTPVALGFLDVMCTALGGGLFDPDRAVGCSVVGSTGMHMRLFPDAHEVRLADEPSGYTMPFPLPGAVAQMQSNMAATLNIDWIVDRARDAAALFGHQVDRRTALAAIDGRVLEGRPGAALYHPYIHEAGERGPFIDVRARAQFFGLSKDVGFLDLARAVYEGLAFAARDCYAAMGHTPEEIRITGGGARSRALKCIMASVLGVPVREVAREEAGAAGAAMMAAVAIGAVPDMNEAVRGWVQPLLGERIQPDRQLGRHYEELFELYRTVRLAMPPLWRGWALARAGGRG